MEGPEHVEVFGSHVVAHLGAGWLSLMVQYLALMEQWRRSLSQGVVSLSSRGPSGELEIHLRAVGSTTVL